MKTNLIGRFGTLLTIIFAPAFLLLAVGVPVWSVVECTPCFMCPTLPKYPGALQDSEDRKNQERVSSVASGKAQVLGFSTPDHVSSVEQFYKNAFEKDGWKQGVQGVNESQWFRGSEASSDFCLKMDIYASDIQLQQTTHVLLLMFKGKCVYTYPRGDDI